MTEQLALDAGCPACGGNRQVWNERLGDYIPCPSCTQDHAHFARNTDPSTSKEAAAAIKEKHGSTAVVRRGSQKHKLLMDAYTNREPAIDSARAKRAGLYGLPGVCWWKRLGEMRDAGYLIVADENGYDPETGKRVRRTVITPLGIEKIRILES